MVLLVVICGITAIEQDVIEYFSGASPDGGHVSTRFNSFGWLELTS